MPAMVLLSKVGTGESLQWTVDSGQNRAIGTTARRSSWEIDVEVGILRLALADARTSLRMTNQIKNPTTGAGFRALCKEAQRVRGGGYPVALCGLWLSLCPPSSLTTFSACGPFWPWA